MPTRHPLARICLFSLLFITSALSQAPQGIPRDLARLRAQQLKDVRYQLDFTIMPKADSSADMKSCGLCRTPTIAAFCRSGWIFVKDRSAA